MKIAITTPTGNIGSKLVQKLSTDSSHQLILLARNANKLKAAEQKGAAIAEGDLTDKEYVIKATQGVDALFWVHPPRYDADNFIEYYRGLAEIGAGAIKANNIKHVVFVSSMGAHLGKGTGVVDGLHIAEKILRGAAENLTILRPTLFMENFLMSAETIKSAGSIFLPVSGDTTLPMIATQDIAEAAYHALLNPASGVKVWSLHGPRDYSFDEAASIIGKAIGKDVTHNEVPADATREVLLKMGMSQDAATRMVELYTAMNTGHMKDEQPRTAETTTSTKLEDFAQRAFPHVIK